MRAAVEDAIARFNRAEDRAPYLDLYAPDAAVHGYPAGIEDAHGVRRFYEELWTALPDAQVTVDDTLVDGDRIAIRYTLRATNRDAYLGHPATGRRVEAMGISIMRLTGDSRIAEEWHGPTELTILSQLGAIAATPGAPADRPPLRRRSASADAAALRWEETHDEA